MTLVRHDIWRDGKGLTMLAFSGDLGEAARAYLAEGSKLIHSFEATSHFDAMTKYYEFMGWGVYEAEFEIDKAPYDLEQLRKRRS